ncbi:MAG: thioesterase family protein, partial [Pseudomonadota bacterium]
RYSFVNPDITIVAHRESDSEWLASSARSDWQSTGIGLSTAVIQDEQGPIATVLQTLLIKRV